MANWQKRTSRKNGNTKGSRTTYTTNSKGGSTRSTSSRVGTGPRITESVKNQNGKTTIRRYKTEYNPSLGRMVTTSTVYNTKKPKKPRKYKAKKYKYRTDNRSYSQLSASERASLRAKPRDWNKHPREADAGIPSWVWWVIGIVALYIII